MQKFLKWYQSHIHSSTHTFIEHCQCARNITECLETQRDDIITEFKELLIILEKKKVGLGVIGVMKGDHKGKIETERWSN